MRYLSVCAIFKNETPYLREWIEYHRLVGVEHFYMLNNSPDPGEAWPTLRPYDDAGVVTHIVYPDTNSPQVPSYNQVLKEYGKETEWMAFIDIDEFLCPVYEPSLLPILSSFDIDPRCCGLSLHWSCFGPGGRLTRPDLQIGTFRYRCPYQIGVPNCQMVKTIAKTRLTLDVYNPHAVDGAPGAYMMNENHELVCVNQNGHADTVPTYRRARVNHYLTRSEQEFKEKMERGVPHGFSPDWRVQIIDRMRESATVYDDTICRFAPKLKEKLGMDNKPTMSWADIPGWFNFEAAYDAAINDAHNVAIFVELGAWLGRSTAYMAEAIKKSGKHICFYTVEHGLGSVSTDNEYVNIQKPVVDLYGGTVAAKMLKNMVDCGVNDYVVPLITTTDKAAHIFQDNSLDFVFIDAAHDYDSVKRDIASWWPKLKSGGRMAGHDYDIHWPQVVKAVNEFCATTEYGALWIGNCWSKVK